MFPDVSTSADAPDPAGIHLTAAEQRILALSMGHLNSRQIADELGVSVDTVFSHRRNIKRKLAVNEWHEVIERCRTLHIL